MKGRGGNETIWEKPGCHSRGSHHGNPWCSLAGGVPFSPSAVFGASFWFAGFALDHLS